MYGMKVHEAVKAAGDLESGITIHIVDARYDEGKSHFSGGLSHPKRTVQRLTLKCIGKAISIFQL